jgi:hypothetical protein
VNGIDLARRFYHRDVAPGLTGVPHAAALLGAGSEVLGFDDEVSTDHDFGPRVQIFLPGDPAAVPPAPGVHVDTVAGFFTARLGVDPGAGMTVADWLLTPTQVLASLTRGAVFHDPYGELRRYRRALAWYPDDVWRYALAAGWLKVGQEEAFLGRTAATGDDLGSRIIAARLARELIRLTFLVERTWAPYTKWLGRAFAGLALADRLDPLLRAAVRADDRHVREDAIVSAAAVVAAATNDLRLCPPVDPSPRRFHTRDIRVLGAERLTVALTAPITDPQLRALLARVGVRHGTVGVLPGTIDQAVDSTDVLSGPARFRRAAPMLGLAD